MYKSFILAIAAVSFSLIALSQEEKNHPEFKKGKGTFYASWGYNLDWFSKSDIHFKNPSAGNNYDFTLNAVKAEDRPGFNQLISIEMSIPQYVYRFGYYFNNKKNTGVEINFDHSKYVMIQDQHVRIKGEIHGEQLDKDTVLHADFIKFEHTNGANFLMANLLKRKSLLHSSNRKHWLSAILKTGAGIVIPKTDVTIFGTRLDNRFHVAGWIAGIEPGLRYDFRHLFVEATGKGTFANYSNVLTIGEGRANHHFWTFETILTAGLQFGL